MKNNKTNEMEVLEAEKLRHQKCLQKLACGKKHVVPGYGTVRAYRAKSGKRMFALSGNKGLGMNGGNLPLKTILEEFPWHLAFREGGCK